MTPDHPAFMKAGLASSAGSAAQPKPESGAARLGEGTTDASELARIIDLLRAAEAQSPVPREVMIGEFTVAGTRVPLSMIEALRHLTKSEAAVLRFMGWGRSNADIATLLNVNDNTVRTHMNNAIRKLNVDGSRGLVCLAGLLFHPLD